MAGRGGMAQPPGAGARATLGPGGRGSGLAAPPGGADRTTQANLQRKALDPSDRLETYDLDIEHLRFDLDDGRAMKRDSSVMTFQRGTASDLFSKKEMATDVKSIDAAGMFGDFNIDVKSSAKAGTELGFEFKAILDNDYSGFSASDFDVEINASSIALAGVSVCANCNESILDAAQGVAVFGKSYHRNHLKCAVTGKDFSDGSDAWEGEDGQVYCQKEWEKRFLKSCTSCKQAIKEKKPLIVNNKPYHKACFSCEICKNVLQGRWYEDDGQLLCENDFHRKRGTVCPACTKPVDGEPKKVGKYNFHKACYVCNYCRREPANFFKVVTKKAGVIYCTSCCARIFPEENK